MKRRPATIRDRQREMFATLMRNTSMMILYYITIWAHPGRPLFRICVQKHSSRTHRFPVLPLDVTALLDSADPKLKRPEERSVVRWFEPTWKSGTPALISGVPLLVYLQEAGSDNSHKPFVSDFNPVAITWILPACPNAECLFPRWRQSCETRAACISPTSCFNREITQLSTEVGHLCTGCEVLCESLPFIITSWYFQALHDRLGERGLFKAACF